MVWFADMADKDDIREGKDFGIGIPQQNRAFHVKGNGALDWGMQNRLARIFNPASGRTVMLAFDHGYFQGPTTGLERIDLNIVPLIPYADVLMCTRGALRSVIPAASTNAVVAPAGSSRSSMRCSDADPADLSGTGTSRRCPSNGAPPCGRSTCGRSRRAEAARQHVRM